MRFARITTTASICAAMLLALSPLMTSSAHAQAPVTKVAIANPVKIFNDIQETGDLKAKMEADRKTLEATDLQKRTKLNDLKTARDALKPDSPQYADRNKELLQASIDYEVWGRLTQADIQRQQKQQIKSLYDKITGVVAEVATKRGIDLVVAEQRPEFPPDLDQLNLDQLKLLINQRNVLFNTALVDISPEVITTMDAKYKAGK
ncbi:MAG TPA: OmpH family outer membrane protein [Tepidisphaeraceae bacterium]|jgi:Skp family chaperone for outer membrane proteins